MIEKESEKKVILKEEALGKNELMFNEFVSEFERQFEKYHEKIIKERNEISKDINQNYKPNDFSIFEAIIKVNYSDIFLKKESKFNI